MYNSHKPVPMIGALLGGGVALALAASMLVTAQANPTQPGTASAEATLTSAGSVPCTESLTNDLLPRTKGVTLEGHTYCLSTQMNAQEFLADEHRILTGSWAHWMSDTHTLQVLRYSGAYCYEVPASLTYTAQGSYALTWQGVRANGQLITSDEQGWCLAAGQTFAFDIVLPTDAPTPVELTEQWFGDPSPVPIEP